VAEFLSKNGVTAMALHGNKSQGARTQALAGFKSGDIRALVATDIAARGIDIDELPHVVNYEIPNVSEDYVHRIGRTGRAGASGEAVNLVCMDEEGFMQDIEDFTKQRIPVQVLEGFGPEPGEKGEPIAMGRQTLWGGAGKPPSREVMAAAAKAARSEMMQRMRDNKGQNGGGGGGGAGRGQGGGNGAGRSAQGQQQRGPQGGGGRPAGGHNGPRHNGAGGGGGGYGGNGGGHGQPDPLRTSTLGGRAKPAPRNTAGGQPDPMRTSVDSMGGGGRNRGFGGGGGGRGGRSGGHGGGGSRGGFGGGGGYGR
jgi:ATP-dependent RNA helicase RhlE